MGTATTTIRRATRTLGCMLAVLLLVASPAAGAVGWTVPTRTTPLDGAVLSAEHEVAAANDVEHLAFARVGATLTGSVQYQRSVDGGASWTPETTLFTTDRTRTELVPNLAVAALAATVGVAWRSRSGGDALLLARFSADAGLHWGPIRQLARVTTTRRMGIPAMAMTSGGIDVAWTDRSNGRIMLRRSVDGGVTFRAAVQVDVTGYRLDCSSATFSEGLVGLGASAGRVIVTWIDAPVGTCSPNRLRVRRSIDAGVTWLPPSVATTIQTFGWPEVVVRRNTVMLFLAAVDGSDLLLRSSDGGVTFVPTSVRAGTQQLTPGDIALGSDDRAMLVYPAITTGPGGTIASSRLIVRTSTDLGAHWQPGITIVGPVSRALTTPNVVFVGERATVAFVRATPDQSAPNVLVVRQTDD